MRGRKSNHQQPEPPPEQQQEEEERKALTESKDESMAVTSASAGVLEDIKMPALTGMDHMRNESSSKTGPKRLACHDEILASAAMQEGLAGDNTMLEAGSRVDKHSSSLAKLVKGWEAYISEGARNVQMLQNLNLCGAGEGLARIAGPGNPFEPLVLRHTHSSPLQYSSTLFDDAAAVSVPSQVAMDQVRRSSSTPSTSAFRQRSANSAFGVHLRTLPHLNGPDDRSAFSLPIHRTSFAAMSDSGISYSAFAPVPTGAIDTPKVDETEKTAIEVTNVGATTSKEKEETEESIIEDDKSRSSALGAASRAARFLSDVRFSRRRRRVRGGRENPARPSSDPSPPQETPAVTLQVAIVDGSADQSSRNQDDTTASLAGLDYCESKQDDDNVDATTSFPLISEDRAQGNSILDTTASSSEHYHQLDSDIDDECEEYQRIEASIQADSPGTIPSPAYQQIVDDRPSSTDSFRDSALPSVRIRVSNSVQSPPLPMDRHADLVSSPNPCEMVSGEGSSLTPQSQDSGRQSRSTLTTNTSGHTTLATSTSATTSSGHLSAISETDREVMETNKAAKMRRRNLGSLIPSQIKSDAADASVNSSSTSSTLHGYVALSGSNTTLREGANVPADRFFKFSQVPSPGGVALATSGTTSSGQARTRPFLTSNKGGSTNSPTTISSSSLAHSNSSSSGEDPPTFVSYLDRQGASDLTSLREDVVSTERTGGDVAEERESPSEIIGYSEVIFEEANSLEEPDSQQPRPIRPMKERLMGRLQEFRYRPPRSPVKGCRPLATPPPLGGVGDALSPANQHLSPPRNIVENPIDTNLSRPSVVRSAPGTTVGPVLVVTPDAGSSQRSFLARSGRVDREEYEMFGTQPGYNIGDQIERESGILEHIYTGLAGSPRDRTLGRVHTFEEGSIEIWKTDSKDEATIVNAVSPEKSVGEM